MIPQTTSSDIPEYPWMSLFLNEIIRDAYDIVERYSGYRSSNCFRASPMISNCLSVADFSISSEVYSLNVFPDTNRIIDSRMRQCHKDISPGHAEAYTRTPVVSMVFFRYGLSMACSSNRSTLRPNIVSSSSRRPK